MGANERLRTAMLKAGLTVTSLAEAAGVDPKTCQRWVSKGRTPHRVNARRAAVALQEDLPKASKTWPDWPAPREGVSTLARTDYYHDPAAPEPNSLVVATSAVVADDEGRILLQRRKDSGNWALPGGAMEMTESLTESAAREVCEETGFEIEITGLVGTYTDPRHVIAYDDGEVRRQFNICYSARITGGEMATSGESTEVRFVSPAELDGLPMHPTQRLRLQHYLENRGRPYLG